MTSYISNITESSEDYGRYLQYIDNLDMSPKEKFELLYIVNGILEYFVDQAFGAQTDQITLRITGKSSYATSFDPARLDAHSENRSTDVRVLDVEGFSTPEGPNEP